MIDTVKSVAPLKLSFRILPHCPHRITDQEPRHSIARRSFIHWHLQNGPLQSMAYSLLTRLSTKCSLSASIVDAEFYFPHEHLACQRLGLRILRRILSLSNDFDHMDLSCSEHFYWELIQKDAVPCFAPDPENDVLCSYADAVNEHRYPATSRL